MDLKSLAFPLLIIVMLLSLFAYAINQRDKYIDTKSKLEGYIQINQSLSRQLEVSQNQMKILDDSLGEWISKKNEEADNMQSDLRKAEKLLEVKDVKSNSNCHLDDALVSLLNKTCDRAKGDICEVP